jgi:hypothetical protein
VAHPKTQTFQLPTRTAVVDASESSDDATKELSFKWALIDSPIGYASKFDESSVTTLTIGDLVAGNYSVKVSRFASRRSRI